MFQTVPVDVKMINVVLVDDHKIIRDGLKALLKGEEINVIGEAAGGLELLDLLETNSPDLIIMDVNMPGLDGFETLKQVRERFPEQKVLILSMLDHEKYVTKMLDLGASGYALKNIGRDELLCGIRLIDGGNKFIGTDLSLALLQKLQQNPASHISSFDQSSAKKASDLSNREIEVLRLIAEGLTNAEIADKLFTSKRTIESHRQNIIEKTQVKNTAALIKYALNNGIID